MQAPGGDAAAAVVRALEPGVRAVAEGWAHRLGLPLEPAPVTGDRGHAAAATLALEVGVDGLALRPAGGPGVRVVPAEVLARPAGGRDLLLRAAGSVEPGTPVADATAGLGSDAFRLAGRGAHVTMIERVPLVAALLEDALERCRSGGEGAEARRVAERLALLVGDARVLLPRLEPPPALVVIDPMYPLRGKHSRPKKGMALLRTLIGSDADAPSLLSAALAVATVRVVVKRPRRAAPLGADAGLPSPSGSVVGTTSRYDIYAPRRQAS